MILVSKMRQWTNGQGQLITTSNVTNLEDEHVPRQEAHVLEGPLGVGAAPRDGHDGREVLGAELGVARRLADEGAPNGQHGPDHAQAPLLAIVLAIVPVVAAPRHLEHHRQEPCPNLFHVGLVHPQPPPPRRPHAPPTSHRHTATLRRPITEASALRTVRDNARMALVRSRSRPGWCAASTPTSTTFFFLEEWSLCAGTTTTAGGARSSWTASSAAGGGVGEEGAAPPPATWFHRRRRRQTPLR